MEKKLFKVHRHFLVRESGVFRGMFMCPPQPEGAEGLTDDKPIPLPGVGSREFERLLDFFYNGYASISIDSADANSIDKDVQRGTRTYR